MESLSPLLVSSILGQGPQADLSPQRQGLSKGQLIAGILADMLAGATGRAPVFAPQLAKQREAEQEQANWGLKRQADLQDYEAKQQIDQRYQPPSPIMRDVEAYQSMTPQQIEALKAMKAITNPEPDVAVTLPDGRFYAGPRSGLADAIRGAVPSAPVGKLTPIGGQTVAPSGGFPY